jgi:hypothetical protein
VYAAFEKHREFVMRSIPEMTIGDQGKTKWRDFLPGRLRDAAEPETTIRRGRKQSRHQAYRSDFGADTEKVPSGNFLHYPISSCGW